MIRKLVAGTATLSLCLGSATPALSQDYRFAGFDGPQGANATINLRIPLGETARRSRPTMGLTLGFGRTTGAGSVEGQPLVRQMRLADFRFSGGGLRNARVVGFDLANLDQDSRLYYGGKSKSPLILAGVAVAVGAVGCVIADCLDGDDGSSDSDDDYETPQPPTGG